MRFGWAAIPDQAALAEGKAPLQTSWGGDLLCFHGKRKRVGWDEVGWGSCCSSWWKSLSASRALLVYTGRGCVSRCSLPPQRRDKEKQPDSDCRRICSRQIRGWKRFLESAEERLADLLAVNYCQRVSPACVLTGEGKMCLYSRNCVECLKKNTVNFRKTGLSKTVVHSALRCRVGASVSSFSISAYRSDITELIMTSL